MIVDHVEVLVEEPSMEAALAILLPRLLGEITFAIHGHSCKSELLARLPARLRAYRRYLPANHRIVVVIDRDGDDCVELKTTLDGWARDAGLTLRPHGGGGPFQVVNRVAI